MNVHNSTAAFDWDDVRIFLAAYRSGALVGAAQQLGVSHSTVRRRLAGLEAALGARLFTATSTGLLPTEAGGDAFAKAERLEAAATAFSSQIAGDARELHGSLVITTVDGLAEYLAPTIARFAQRHPHVLITLITDNRTLDLARREADLAVRLTNAPDERLFGRKIGTVAYAPFAAASLIARCGRDVSRLPWILYDEAAQAVESERWYAEQSAGRAPIARVSQAMAMLSLARAGLGGAVLPTPLATSAGLVALDGPIAGFETELWCLCHNDQRHASRIRSFMEELVAHGIDF